MVVSQKHISYVISSKPLYEYLYIDISISEWLYHYTTNTSVYNVVFNQAHKEIILTRRNVLLKLPNITPPQEGTISTHRWYIVIVERKKLLGIQCKMHCLYKMRAKF